MIALLAAIHFDVFEGFASWAQRYEGWQVDALLILPVFLATVLAFLFWRRYEELHRQRDLYEGVLTAQSELGEGLIVIEDGRIGYANEAFCEMSGYGQEELTALPSFTDLVAEEERDSILERGRRRLGGEEIETRYDTTLRHKDGHPVDIEVAFKELEARGRCHRTGHHRAQTDGGDPGGAGAPGGAAHGSE